MNQNESDFLYQLETLRRQNKITEVYTKTDEYLSNTYLSIDFFVRLSVLFDTPPIADEEKSIFFAEQVLEKDPKNPYAIIMLAYIYNFDTPPFEITSEIFEKLESLNGNEPEIQSMIEFVKSWYWENKDSKKYIDVLKKSIYFCDQYVKSFDYLGSYYIQNNEIAKGLALRKVAFQNVKKVYSDKIDEQEDILEDFLNENIKGTSVTQWKYDELAKIAELADSYEQTLDK